jgi:hypothetical protein
MCRLFATQQYSCFDVLEGRMRVRAVFSLKIYLTLSGVTVNLNGGASVVGKTGD